MSISVTGLRTNICNNTHRIEICIFRFKGENGGRPKEVQMSEMKSFIIFLSELNETVICTNDHMEVVIPSTFFLNKVPPVYVSELQ